MRNVTLFATGSASGNAIAQVVIPTATRLKAVQVAIMIDCITDNAQVRCELSKIPTSLIGTNGAIDPFASFSLSSNFVTNGLAQGGLNQTFPLDVECRQGEIIYLHVAITGTAGYFFTGVFHY